MSIADQITRIKQLRNNIASKLWELRITEGTETDTSTLNLQECKDVIDTMGGTLYLNNTNTTNVAKYEYVEIDDINLKARNIKKDVSILGIRGLYDNAVPIPVYDSTCNIIYGLKQPPENYNPAPGKDAFPAITYTKPDDTCTNMTLRPENIKYGVRILGVDGTYNWNTMNFAYSDGFNPSVEGDNVGINENTRSITWALYDLNDNYIPISSGLAVQYIQRYKIHISDTSISFKDYSKNVNYIIEISYAVKHTNTGFEYIVPSIEHCRITLFNQIKKQTIYDDYVYDNHINPFIYYDYDNNNHYRAYLTINFISEYDKIFEDYKFLPLPYHIEIKW